MDFLNADVDYLQRGYLRLLAAFKLRPEVLWTADNSVQPWERVAEVVPGADIVDYWAAVSTPDDAAIAKHLAADSKQLVSKLGMALLALNDPAESVDAIIAVEPKLILNRRVIESCGGAPLERAGVDVLIDLMKRQFLSDRVHRAVTEEIARRDAWTKEIVETLLQRDRVSLYLGDSWKPHARDLLFRSTTLHAMTLLIDEIKTKKANEIPLLLAELASVNSEFREVYLPQAPDHLESGDLEELFTLHANDPSYRNQAHQVLAGGFEPSNRRVAQLRAQGAGDELISFVEERDFASALTYLARIPPGLTKAEGDRLRSLAGASGRFRYDLLVVLEQIATDSDIPTLLESTTARWRDDPNRLGRLLGRATLTRLRALLDHEVPDIVLAALAELDSRDRLPTQSKLKELLRHNDAGVRMAALRLLAPQVSDLAEFIPAYVQAAPTYYYNVVCELDRLASGSPQVY